MTLPAGKLGSNEVHNIVSQPLFTITLSGGCYDTANLIIMALCVAGREYSPHC